jgi:hypothetical protein
MCPHTRHLHLQAYMDRSPAFQLIFDSDFEASLIKKFIESLISKLTMVVLSEGEALHTSPPTDGNPTAEKILFVVADGLVSIDMNGKVTEGARDFFYGEQIVRPSSPYLCVKALHKSVVWVVERLQVEAILNECGDLGAAIRSEALANESVDREQARHRMHS